MRKPQVVAPVFLVFTALAIAQTQQPPSFQSQVNVVLVPTLVMNKSGEIVHGLSAKDFVIEEAGVEQAVKLDDAPEAEPMSVVVALQCGRSAKLEFQPPPMEHRDDLGHPLPAAHRVGDAPLGGLGEMVEGFIGETPSEVAVVTFDSHVQLRQNFTANIPAMAERLADLQRSGDYGAAILDAVSYSLDLLDQRPNRRRVVLLISEQRDHGSKIASLETVVQRITESNTLIYSVVFSPLRSEFARDAKGQSARRREPRTPQQSTDARTAVDEPQPTIDLLRMIALLSNSMKKNMAQAMADMTGGEYRTFKNKHSFDAELEGLANHVRNRYLLSFQPKDPKFGPHRITVRLRDPGHDTVVLARSTYWVNGVAR